MNRFFPFRGSVSGGIRLLCLGSILVLGCTSPSKEEAKTIQRAGIHFDNGRYTKALAEYEKVLADNPEHYEARLGVGKCYLAKKAYAEAREAFESSAKLRPDEADPWLGLARVALAGEPPDFPTAVDFCAEAISRQPERADLRIFLGSVYVREGMHAEAVNLFREAARLDPENAGLRVLLAQSLVQSGQMKEAEELLENSLSGRVTQSAAVRTALSQIREAEGRLEEALTLVEDLGDSGVSPSARYQRGRLYLRMARDPACEPVEREELLRKAQADGDALLAQDPQGFTGMEVKGIALFDQEKYNDALLVLQEIRTFLDRQLSVPQDFPTGTRRRVAMLLLHLGRCFMETDLPRKAGESFIRATNWDPDGIDAYFWSAVSQLQIDDRQGAANGLERMIERVDTTGFQRGWIQGRELYPPLEARYLRMLETWAEEDPIPVSPLLGLAQLALRLDQPEECLAWCAKASERAPNRAETHYLQGAALFQQGKYPEGLESLRAAKDADPRFLPPYLRLAAIYQRGRRPDLAIREYLSALKNREDRQSELMLGLARAYAAIGDDARAIENLTKVIDQDPDDLVPLQMLTSIYVRRGRVSDPVAYDKMVSLCDRILDRDPENEWALAIKAEALIRKGNLSEAESILKALLDVVPTSVTRSSAYASVLALRGEFDTALEVTDVAQRLSGATAELSIIQAFTRLLQDEPARAIQILSAPYVIEQAPGASKVLRAYAELVRGDRRAAQQLLGALSEHSKEEVKFFQDYFPETSSPSPDDAKALAKLVFLAYRGWWNLAWEEALEIGRRSGDKAQALWWEAEAARRLNRLNETYRLLGELVEKAPYSGRGWIALATIEGATDPTRAIQFYRRALPLFAGDVNWLSEIHFRIGMLSEQTGAEAEAIQQYQLALEQDPNHALAANNLAVLLMDQSLEEAKELARRAVEAKPSRGEIRDTYGWICFRLGDLETALSELRLAASLTPYHPSIRYHLARALHEADEVPRVRAELEMALAIGGEFPEREEAEKLLNELPPAQE